MKTAAPIPSHPHTATLKLFESGENGTGPKLHLIAVEITVPSRVAAMLPENGDTHVIGCARIGNAKWMNDRARYWKSSLRVGTRTSPPLASLLEPTVTEGCDTRIMIAITPDEWHLVGILCGKLGITAGQWYLACAAHSARCEQDALDVKLAAILDALDEL